MSVSLSNLVTENIVYYYGLAFVLVATAFKESSLLRIWIHDNWLIKWLFLTGHSFIANIQYKYRKCIVYARLKTDTYNTLTTANFMYAWLMSMKKAVVVAS